MLALWSNDALASLLNTFFSVLFLSLSSVVVVVVFVAGVHDIHEKNEHFAAFRKLWIETMVFVCM